jgi:8-amino-7-oxononanoate synthase
LTVSERIQAELKILKEDSLFRSPVLLDRSCGECFFSGCENKILNFCSNDYLGLAADQEMSDTLSGLVKKYGTGAGSSRLISGNYSSLVNAERKYADFFGYADALFFSSGFQANSALISTIFSADDVIYFDKQIHSSMVSGLQLSDAKSSSFRHNSLSHLVSRIERNNCSGQAAVLTEGCFSMAGDIPDFEQLSNLKSTYNLFTIIDEAHSLGVCGDSGRGVSGNIADIKVGTLGKAFGFYGAFLLLPEGFKDYLINRARPLIYTTALPPFYGDYVSILLDKIITMDNERDLVRENASYAIELLTEKGFSVSGDAHILAVHVGVESKAVAAAQQLRSQGIFAAAVRYPTVAYNKAILRLGITSSHSKADIDILVSTLKKIFVNLGL